MNFIFLKDRNDQSWDVTYRSLKVGDHVGVNGFPCTVISTFKDDIIVESTKEAEASYDAWLKTWQL